ncbi:amidohydrolase [Microcoleus sp. FACHB-1515]|uniref:amidohydrolase n=1 Tax=Cyanophyceae TaxID=3028117 RepID=UPI0016849B2F|nr:amidohydrolase family protein [Microcoleus sp. FACHB-1515]MBD2089544.1 amidohydrolase [Microcoleus sp. FACHB-1515]
MNYTIRGAIVPGCFNQNEGYESIDVQIVDGRIAAIGSGLEVQGTAIDGTNKLLLPGFVNAHTHSSEMWQRGSIPPRPLELWLAELYDFSPLDPQHIYLSALHTAAETLLTGGTCVVDHLVLIPHREIETIAAAVRAYREIGIRAYVAPLIQDQSISTGIPEGGAEREHEAFPRTTEEVLAWLTEAIEQFHRPDEGICMMPAPTGIHLASDALLKGCVELSDRYDLCRHTHLLETKAQKLIAEEKYGYSAVEHLKRLDFLNERTSLAHCVWLDDADIEILAATRSTVVHNPLSNLRLGSGIAPILKYRRAGVNVTFGCDGAASNDSQDVLEAIKIGSMLHNVTDLDYREWITPREAIEMAALGGAIGLGMADQFGSLTIGKQADLVLYDLTNLSLLPRTDPIGLLVWGRPTQVVHSAWVAGRQVIAEGQLTTIDLAHLQQELFRHSNWHSNRSSPQAMAAESHYRSVMGLKP